jgi:hypothetical protein
MTSEGAHVKRFLIMCVSAAATIGISGPAMAEGHWASYWNNVLPQRDTRSWYDGNSDAVHTKTAFRRCRYDGGSPTLRYITMQLTYENTWTPDENVKTWNSYCNTTSWVTYDHGDVKRGDYHMTLMGADGSDYVPNYIDVGSSSTTGIDVVY